MKKKLLSMVLGTAMAAGLLLGGCGSTGAETKGGVAESGENAASAEDVTIEFWTIALQPTFTDFFNGLIEQYETENPHVTVKWSDLPQDSIHEKLVTSVAGGTSPDVVNLNTHMALTLAGKGALVDLNKEATEEQKSIYIPGLFESAQAGESCYAFPWYASPNIMFYNTELFEKAGIEELPTTYEEANAVAKQMKDATGAYLYNPPQFYELFFEEGISILNEDRSAAAFNTQETVDLVTKFQEYTKEDILPKDTWGDWDEELKMFETGKLAIISSSGSSLSRIKDEAPDIYEKIAVGAPLRGATGLSGNPLMNVVIPEASKNHEEAIKFAAWLTNDANQLAFCKEVAIFPSTKEAAADEYFVSDVETLEGQARAMSVSLSETSKDYSLGVEGQSNIQDDLKKAYEAAIKSGGDVKEALTMAEQLVNDELK